MTPTPTVCWLIFLAAVATLWLPGALSLSTLAYEIGVSLWAAWTDKGDREVWG